MKKNKLTWAAFDDSLTNARALLTTELSEALTCCNDVMTDGEKTHEKDDWRVGPKNKNMYHAIEHLKKCYKPKSDDNMLEDLSHAATRSLMALQLFLDRKK